jgi:hypothetical protein
MLLFGAAAPERAKGSAMDPATQPDDAQQVMQIDDEGSEPPSATAVLDSSFTSL